MDLVRDHVLELKVIHVADEDPGLHALARDAIVERLGAVLAEAG